MNKIIVFDTAIGTSNLGDIIILKSLEEHMGALFQNSSCMRYGTHLNNFSFYSYWRNRVKRRFAENCDYKFIMGTNLLSYDIFKTRRQWVIGLSSHFLYRNSIMAGVGTTQGKRSLTLYSKIIYRLILNKDLIHSVRDEESLQLLSSIGFKAINTGCPTLWKLTPDWCRQIPTVKSKRVVFSLSGYNDQLNREQDKKMLDILKSNYSEIFFWCQTTMDSQYLDSFEGTQSIHQIYTIDAFSKLLDEGDIDYVGTRLHGGIFALQHKVRSIVIAIDHRARGFQETNNIICLERSQIEALDDLINSEFETNIRLRQEEIDMWKSQFSI